MSKPAKFHHIRKPLLESSYPNGWTFNCNGTIVISYWTSGSQGGMLAVPLEDAIGLHKALGECIKQAKLTNLKASEVIGRLKKK